MKKTPFEIWNGCKPDISHLSIFGSNVIAHIAKEKRQKWDKKSEKQILMGYPDDIKGYRIYNPRSKYITTSRDVIIMEDENNPEVNILITESGENSCPVRDTSCKDTSSSEDITLDEDTLVEDVSDDTYTPDTCTSESYTSDYEDAGDSPEQRIGSSRISRKPERYGMLNMCIPEGVFDDARRSNTGK